MDLDADAIMARVRAQASAEEGQEPRPIEGDAFETETDTQKEKWKTDSQEKFSSLLKQTMAQAEANSQELDADTVSSTLKAVQTGDLGRVDVKALLGDSLAMLTETLGIDMQQELQSDATQAAMQNIMGNSMAELVENMKELDEESSKLYVSY